MVNLIHYLNLIFLIIFLRLNLYNSLENIYLIYLNEEIGEDIPEGKSHNFIVFQKV